MGGCGRPARPWINQLRAALLAHTQKSPLVKIGNTVVPWYESVVLGFQLLAARALAGDEEIRDFLTEAKVTVTDPTGEPLWPPTN